MKERGNCENGISKGQIMGRGPYGFNLWFPPSIEAVQTETTSRVRLIVREGREREAWRLREGNDVGYKEEEPEFKGRRD